MRFWTALQEPFNQAAFVLDGRIVMCIPDHPPKTPVRKGMCVSEFDGNLVIARRSHVELWKPDSSAMLGSYYHPFIFMPHEVQQYQEMFLIASAGIDVLLLMDQDCRAKWAWWAHQEGYCPKIAEVESDQWPVVQTTWQTYSFLRDTCHLNSARVFGDEAIITLMKRGLILSVRLGSSSS